MLGKGIAACLQPLNSIRLPAQGYILRVGAIIAQAYSSTVAAGIVMSQNPAAGASLPPGCTVNRTVSLSPKPVVVPNVVGMTQSAAQSWITRADLVVGTMTQIYNSTAAGTVISQYPQAGTNAYIGSSVNLVVSKGKAP